MPQSPTTSRRPRSMSSPGMTTLIQNTLVALSKTKPTTPPPNDLSNYLSKTPKRNAPGTPTRKRKVSKDSNPAYGDENTGLLDPLPQTPARRSVNREAGPSFDPVTPRKVSSPFSNMFTPFRTPGRRSLGVFDPSDPISLLNEELDALASARNREAFGSPGGGIFPRGRGILYESPNLPSPDKWRPW